MALLSRGESRRRLERIFPPDVVDDRVVAGRLAASAVFVFGYCDAVDGRTWLRPSAVLWMDDAAARRTAPSAREAWCAAAARGHAAVRELLARWKVEHEPWYAENSRETLRDEVFRGWQRLGAIRRDESLATTSSKPAWTLEPDFAALFDPTLTGTPLRSAIDAWQTAHLGPVGLARQAVARRRSQAGQAVHVRLPGGQVRSLRPGHSSLILQGVVESLAPRLLGDPAVLAISESSRRVDLVDAELLDELGMVVRADRLLPDALLFDADGGDFVFVEAVATDGEISAARQADLLAWAAGQGVPADRCRFITAFLSRTQDAFRRRAASLAPGTLVWFLSEPDLLLRLDVLPEAQDAD